MLLGNWTNHIIRTRGLLSVTLLFVTIGADQYTKFLAKMLLDASDDILILNSFLKFSLIANHGGFLGIVNNLPKFLQFFLLNVCVALLLLWCLVYIFGLKKKTTRYEIPLVFVTGGGISNLLDRIFHNGGVIDFLSIGFSNFRTGIFNLADVYILIGSFILGYLFLSSPQKSN